MSARREDVLKKLMPALAVTVFYFIFIGNGLSDSLSAARLENHEIVRKGVSPAAMQGLEQKVRRLDTRIKAMESRKAKIEEALQTQWSVLSDPGYANRVSERISSLLGKHDLRIVEEERNDKTVRDLMGPSVRWIHQWLQEGGKKAGLTVWRTVFRGGYLDTLRAMKELAEGELPIIPLALHMRKSDRGGVLEWTLLVAI